jgi:predicted transcriptional regulator
MRTTLTLDEDVAQRTKKLAVKLKKPFKVVLNEALRKGLDQVEKSQKRRDYRTIPHEMGLQEGLSIDNIQELLAHVEGENRR